MKKVKVNYDVVSDVLYLSFGDPRPSFTEDYADGVYVRYDMDTDELSGITIIDFSKRTEQLRHLSLPGNITFDDMNGLLH
ncbi:DUF2283 domain-containing protein [Paenibacillus sp. sptzw28]|uniref:DUF2283 domain-containing protein n=1 Tax=Paenibacillus sp. sptzw28 TaxID=715179 RepID=UPI001C6EC693|nr:DUF2283 domain-containing protein [Paenibacillus sp. sptzw28]QYR20785.1 DUF2283 domain-containing protein [Paenibacillus sp. sptzw28]